MRESVIAICVAATVGFISYGITKEGAQKRYIECVQISDTPARAEFCKEILK